MTIAQFFTSIVAWIVALFTPLSYAHVIIPAAPAPKAEIFFVGDLMFDRSIRAAADHNGGDYLFSCIDPVLEKADVVIGNLEGPITASSSVSLGSSPGDDHNFTFTFATTTAELLKRHNIGIVNLGNNHIMNFGLSGLNQTKQYLTAAGVSYFGDPDASESDKVLRTTIRGIDFSFVNWSDWTSDKTDHTVAQVRAEAASGRVVVVYTHWGVEYVPPIPRVRELAHEFVDAGASIVIGSHPHIVQEHEVYHGKDIYYSLGNFIFDQYFSEAVRHGLALDVTFSKSGVMQVNEISVELERDRTTCLTAQSTR